MLWKSIVRIICCDINFGSSNGKIKKMMIILHLKKINNYILQRLIKYVYKVDLS